MINVDALTYAGNQQSLQSVENSARYHFEHADVCDANHMRSILTHRPDAVMHLAAESHVDRSINCAEEFIQTNVIGTFRLLEVASDYWEKLPTLQASFRFHHISTDEVFGDLGANGGRFSENSIYAPRHPYQ